MWQVLVGTAVTGVALFTVGWIGCIGLGIGVSLIIAAFSGPGGGAVVTGFFLFTALFIIGFAGLTLAGLLVTIWRTWRDAAW